MTVFLCTLFLACGIETVYNSYGRNYSERIEINLDERENIQGESQIYLTTANISSLVGGLSKGAEVAYISETFSFAERNSISCPIREVTSSASYQDFSGLELVKGTFLNKDSCKYGENVAVVSEELAKKLFSSFDIIGEEFNLSGERYKILGIYKNRRSVISLLGSDGGERIYIPYESLNQSAGLKIKTVFIRDKSLENDAFRVDTLRNVLQKSTNVNSDAYVINDYYDIKTMFSQYKGILFFFVGLFIIYCLSVNLLRYMKRYIYRIMGKESDSYFFETVRIEKWLIVKAVSILALSVVAIFVTWWAVKFKINIPPQYVPQNNVFDLGFYAGKIKDTIIAHNASFGNIPSCFEVDFRNIHKLSFLLAICLVIELFLLVSSIKLVKVGDKPQNTCLKGIVVSLPVVAGISFALSMLLGISFTFPVKELIVFVTFIFVYIQKESRQKQVTPASHLDTSNT